MTSPRGDLAELAREYLLAGHLIDRAGMPLVLGEHGREAMEAVAIDEWMAASPLYTRRMQRLLGFEGDDVATIFKGMQLDIGAPPEFMDFRYLVHDETRGEFWLDSCGALMDVEPMGEELVVTMCHHIEDPTFDATAHATNPRARVRPLHRPPRQPADRHPHCHWTVQIGGDEDAGDSRDLRVTEDDVVLAGTQAAQLPVHGPAADAGLRDDDGLDDYSGAFDPDLQLESFSQRALLAILDEVALQGHLLALAFARAAERRFGAEAAASLSLRQFTGIAGLTARRLEVSGLPANENERFWSRPRRAFRYPSGTRSMDRLAAVLELHPAFRPRSYVDLRVTPGTRPEDDDGLLVEIGPCPALEEEQPSWLGLLAAGQLEPLEAIVQAVEPRARVERLEGDTRGTRWQVRVDATAEPAGPADEVKLAAFSTGAEFSFVGVPRRRSSQGAPT